MCSKGENQKLRQEKKREPDSQYLLSPLGYQASNHLWDVSHAATSALAATLPGLFNARFPTGSVETGSNNRKRGVMTWYGGARGGPQDHRQQAHLCRLPKIKHGWHQKNGNGPFAVHHQMTTEPWT